MREDGEISFTRLFDLVDSDLEQRKQRLTGTFIKDPLDYAKEFGALKAVETLRFQLADIADKAQNEEE